MSRSSVSGACERTTSAATTPIAATRRAGNSRKSARRCRGCACDRSGRSSVRTSGLPVGRRVRAAGRMLEGPCGGGTAGVVRWLARTRQAVHPFVPSRPLATGRPIPPHLRSPHVHIRSREQRRRASRVSLFLLLFLWIAIPRCSLLLPAPFFFFFFISLLALSSFRYGSSSPL